MRTDRGLTLTQLAKQTGLNVGYLSQIETDKASPSLDSLAAIAEAFDVPITWLLTDIVVPPRLVRTADRPRHVSGDGTEVMVVDGGFARELRIVEVVAPPGTRSPLRTDVGEEHHLILTGRMRARQGDFEVVLEPGDYLIWDGSIPHEMEVVGNEPSRALIITPGPAGVGKAAARDT